MIYYLQYCTELSVFRFKSSLISGEGLGLVGTSEEVVKSTLDKIHQENVDRLSGYSEAEILQEKERIENEMGE